MSDPFAFVVAVAVACTAHAADALGDAPLRYDVSARATSFAALVLATAALARGVTRGPHAILTLAAVACAAIWAFTPVRGSSVALIGNWIAIAVFGGPRPAAALVTLGIAPAIAMHGAATTLASAPDDLYLHDTYFVVAQEHLASCVLAFAALAVLHAWSRPIARRDPHVLLAWFGTAAASAGIVVHSYASIQLGAEGMPRRYWAYVPELADGHQLAGKGAALAVGGLVLLALAWFSGTRAPREPSTPDRT